MDARHLLDPWDRIKPAAMPGERVVVRSRLPDGSATDVIGWLELADERRVVVRDHHGLVVEVARGLIVAARRAPPARGGQHPRRTSAADLEQIALPGWIARSEPMGEWTLRAADGFTGRANSCLAVGDPGVGISKAAQRIVDFAATYGGRPWAQVIMGSEPEEQLRGLGWTDVYDRVDVLVARLVDLLGNTPADPRVSVSQSLQPSWEDAYQLSRPNSADPQVLRQILAGGSPLGFASVEHQGRLIAIGRGHVSANWLGIASLWTAPPHRREGWAVAIMTALGHWAARSNARYAYLQVAADNETAHRAYERSGFVRHHGYLYLSAPHPITAGGPQSGVGSL